jgi:flagellar basal-body rod protein FlgC
MDLNQAMEIAAAGMKVQGARMRLVAQNLANADSTALAPGGTPYRRQTITFESALDRARGVR